MNRAFHGAAESDTALKLLGDALGNKVGVNFRFSDFNDVQVNFAVCVFLQIVFQLLDVGAFFTDQGYRGAPNEL